MSIDIDFISHFITEDPDLFNETLPPPLGGVGYGEKPKPKPKKPLRIQPKDEITIDPETGKRIEPGQPTQPQSPFDKAISSPVVDQLLKASPQFNRFFHQILDKMKKGLWDETKAITMLQKAVNVSLDRA